MTTLTPEASFDVLKNNVTQSISSYFPYEGKHRRLELHKIWVDDKLHTDDIKSQTEAKDHDRTWGVPVKADVSLIDKITGKVVDRKTMTVARLPKLTSRFGFIVDGSEYQVDHLFRLKSGVYARVQDNGDLESEFNLVKGPAGNRFSIQLERESKKFFLKQGDAHIPLYPILKSMGVADDDLERDWGKEILAANRPKTEAKTLKSLQTFWKKTSFEDGAEPKDIGSYSKYVYDFFDKTVLRPDTTRITLGRPAEKVDGNVLRIASNKILGVSRGTQTPDDRDSLAFKEIVSVEDFLPEKIERSLKTIKGKLRNTIDLKDKVSVTEVMSTDLFARPIREFFTKGGSLTERSDQTNPIQMMSGHRKTTLMAADLGGIKKEHSITNEMRVINPSHFGFLDPMHTPESERTGITLHLGMAARKVGKELETPVYNVKDSKIQYLQAPDFHNAYAVLPDQVRWVNGKPQPIADHVKMKLPGGGIESRPFKDAHYVMPSAKGMFDLASNLIPFLPSNQGNRVSMADKQMEQAIALKNREAPLVQSKTDHADPNMTFEKVLGGFTAHRAPVSGKVTAVSHDSVTITDGKKKHQVHLYNNFPLNDPKGMMHSQSIVAVGDSVRQGQIIADNNFTKDGTLALGANLRVGYIPYKGYNYEDGIVISESAAKKLTSEHLFKKKIELDPEHDLVSKSKFIAFAATKANQLTKAQLDLLDNDGIIQVGSKVHPGQVLIAAVGKNQASRQSSALAALGKRAFQPYKDKSLVWDEDHVGEVVKVVKDPSGRGAKVYVRTAEQMVVGDKLSGRHGNKGIITMILPDHEMPFTVDAKGERRPLEVLLNPTGVPTRINVGQVLETAAGKIAEKTGKTYIVNNFSGPNTNYRETVLKDLKKHGLSDEETVFDPKNPSKALGSVLVGPQHLLKLKHQVEKKLTVRGGGTDINGKGLPYDTDKTPTKGGERGGQGFGALDLYSLLGHDARHNLREMATYKSDFQDMTFWNMVQEGHEPPPPRPPFSYEKFVGLLKGLGVNVDKKGTALQLTPLTNKQIVDAAGGDRGALKNPHLALRAKDLKEEKGGLFDPVATGGLSGTKWSFIPLTEPLPNPIFVGSNNRPGPVPTLLGIKLKELDEIMKGTRQLDGKTGGTAIHDALKKIDVTKEMASLRERISSLSGTDLDRANKKLKYLSALKDAALAPHEAYVLHNIPVLPPAFRPATVTPKGDVQYSSLNGLYKNIAILNNKLDEVDPKLFSEDHRSPIRWQLYDSLRALQSIGGSVGYDTDSPGSKRKLKGILDIIGGGDEEQPKEGFFQSKLVKRRQNLSIRSTIVPEPKLGIDEVGIPKGAAMELYKPFVVAELSKHGFDPLSAQQEMKNGSKSAYDALERVVKDRPLLLKRDPALHKFSIMAFTPRLVEGKAIQIHPLVTGGYNADFDGDSIDLDTPIPLRISGQVQQITGHRIAEMVKAGEGNWVSTVRNLEALTYNGWRPIKTISFHKVEDKKKFRITLKNGISFIASEDHSLMIGRAEAKPGQVRIGDELDHTNAPCSDASSKGESYELGVIYGNFLGDGSAEERPTGGGRISIACKPELERQYLIDLWKKNFGVHVTDSKHGYFQVSNVNLANKFLSWCGRYCTGKAIMGPLSNLGLEFAKGLLAGYIQSDGSVELTKSGSWLVRTWSKSKTLRDDMAFIANMLGLPFSVRERTKKKVGKCYLLSFGKEAIKLLDYRIPGKKGDLLRQAVADYETNRNDNRTSQSARGFEVKSIEEVEYTDRMIDIEVDDESHVFAIFGGVIVHNTMAGTVPLTREAVEEAKKMFPSKNLFSPTTGGVMYAPTQDSMLGLHLISKWGKKVNKAFKTPLELNKAVEKGTIDPTDVVKVGGKETTFGRLLLESRMPRDFKARADILHNPSFVIDKKVLNNQIISPLAKNHTRDFANVVNDLKDLGNEYAFKMGFSFGLKDLQTVPERDRIIAAAHKEADAVRRSVKDKKEQNLKIIDVYQRATEKMEAASKAVSSENRLATMVSSGARGKLEQLRQMIAAPMLVQDSHNNVIPTPITKNYAEGLDIGDYWLAQHGARKGTLQRVLGTSEPGVVSKDIINSTMSTIIASPDCKTHQGLLMDINHRDIHDRFTSKPYKLKDGTNVKAGTLLTPELTSRFKNSKIDKVLVRSALKCEHGEGICAKCFGLNESGKLHDTGINIGVLAGQALSEPAVQMAMDAFHTGGVATGRGALSVDRLTRLRNALNMPKKLKNSATLAKATGKITDIKKDAVGGIDVFVGNERHYVPKDLVSSAIAVGTEVKKGQPISDGFINPHHLLPLTDIHTVQNYLTNEMYSGLYEKEGVRKRNVEVVVRALTNLSKIKDPGSSDFMHGDVTSNSVIEDYNRNLPKGKKHITHEPILRGIAQVPLTGSTDWMARLNYRELHSTIQQAASQGWKSDIHGKHPIPGMAFGAEFGKPPAGSKKGHY